MVWQPLKVDNDIWISMKNRTNRDISIINSMEYVAIEFILNDLKSPVKTIIDKKMYDDKIAEFKKIVEERKKNG